MKQNEIYHIITEKYDKLLWSIAAKISGDYAIASLEDNYQDLWMAVLEAIEGFSRQNDGANGPIEDWIKTKSFDKYIKTCLWNKKNHKGKIISSRYHVNRDVLPINEEILQFVAPEDLTFSQVSDDFGDFLSSLSSLETKVIACILDEPARCLTARGKVKIKPVQEHLGWTRDKTFKVVDRIKKKMNTNLTQSI